MSQLFEALADLALRLTGSAAIVAVVGIVFWKADDWISKSGKDLLDKAIKQSIEAPERSDLRVALLSFLKRYFSPHLPASIFAGNVALLTISSMIILFIAYLFRVEAFFGQLKTDPYALQLVLGQFFLNGFVVAFAVNYCAFSLYSFLLERADLITPILNITIIVADIVIKIALFVLVTATLYIGFAYVSGSFAGDPIRALGAVSPTVASGLRFENLTAVYVYSVAISSLPLFLIGLINLLSTSPRLASLVRMLFFWLPLDGRPMRTVALALGLFAAVFYQVASLVVAVI